MNGKVTYRQQYTRCGKERCRKCKEGAGHGPYWYAYWSENGRTISKYVGIHPPAEMEQKERQRPPTSLNTTVPVEEQLETVHVDVRPCQDGLVIVVAAAGVVVVVGKHGSLREG